VTVSVFRGTVERPFEAVGYIVRDRSLLLYDRAPSKSADGPAFCVRLSGDCSIVTTPTRTVVSMSCAPGFTVVKNGVDETRCTALDSCKHPLADLIPLRDVSVDDSSRNWSVRFTKKAEVVWAPVLFQAPIQMLKTNGAMPRQQDSGLQSAPQEPPALAPVRTIVVTPTTHRHNAPLGDASKSQGEADDRCHFFRVLGRGAFVTVALREEDGNAFAEASPEIVERWEKVLGSDLNINHATYTFFTLGSVPNQAYFIDTTKQHDAIRALGVEPATFEKLPIHTRLKRLRLGFSTTTKIMPELGKSFTVDVVPDIKATDRTVLTDGSGVMSDSARQFIRTSLAKRENCSGVQYRMGAFKGTFVAARGALPSGKDFEIFESCEKVPCTIDGSTPLNVIATSKWSAGARLDKLMLAVLIEGGLPLHSLMALGLEGYKTRCADLAPEIARVEMYRRQKITLWNREVVAETIHHLQIGTAFGAKLMGFIDPSGDLKPTAKDPADAKSTLPCVFVAKPSSSLHRKAYRRLTKAGKAVITRSPTYALGDVRVVRVLTARDVPALNHLRDMLVFPRQGPTSLPALMSGGDLDGDEFTLVWDERVLRSFRTITIKQPPTVAPEVFPSNSLSATTFAAKCLNERVLLAKLHRAQLGWLLADPHGAQAKRCAALCMQEVDGRAGGRFIHPASVKDLLDSPGFIATAGGLTQDVRQVRHFLDVYVAAPRLSVQPWWTAIAAVQQTDGMSPCPEDEILAAVGFPAQQGLGRLTRLQWCPSAGLHRRRVEHMPLTNMLDVESRGTPVRGLKPSSVDRAIAVAKRREGDCGPIAFKRDSRRLPELTQKLKSAVTALTDPTVLTSLYPACTDPKSVEVTLRVSSGRSFYSYPRANQRVHGGSVDSTLPGVDRSPPLDKPHVVHGAPVPPRGLFAAGVSEGTAPREAPKPVFGGMTGTTMKARSASEAAAECEALVSHVADVISRRFGGVARDTIETTVTFRAAIRPHLPLVFATVWTWSVDVGVDTGPVPVLVADLDEQQIKFGPIFYSRGCGMGAPAETLRFGIRAVGKGLLPSDHLGLSQPIAHLELDDTRGAFPVKFVDTDRPPAEIVKLRLVGKALVDVIEPKTKKQVQLRVEVRATFDPLYGHSVWDDAVWELEPCVIVDARNPALVNAARAAMDTLLDASNYKEMLPSDELSRTKRCPSDDAD
jgi:hypothetical protein